MKPKMIDEETGRIIERTQILKGLFYYRKRVSVTHQTVWVGIKNLGEIEVKVFGKFEDCLNWLMGGGELR